MPPLPPKLDAYPLLVYEYDKQGFTQPTQIPNAAEMKRWFHAHLVKIINERRQLRITDMDDFMVYHVENGHLLFDGQTEYPPPGRDLIKEMSERGQR